MMTLLPRRAEALRPFARPGHFPRRARIERAVMSLREAPDAAEDWSGCIVAIARTRDRTRFAELFLFFAPRLKAFFVRLGVASGAAEDLAQEVMFTVWRKADYFDPERASAATWIFTIARNLRIDLRRREQKPALSENDLDYLDGPDPGEQKGIEINRARRIIGQGDRVVEDARARFHECKLRRRTDWHGVAPTSPCVES